MTDKIEGLPPDQAAEKYFTPPEVNNEAREQIAKEGIVEILCSFYSCCNTKRDYGCFTKRENWGLCASVDRATQILEKLKVLGYRSRPQLTLITDEEIIRIWNNNTGIGHYPTIDFGKLVARAQLDHDREG